MPNPFDTERAARLYKSGRPDFSDRLTPLIRRLTGISGTVSLAVDVGSGTGISTHALAPLADAIIGVEPSSAMLDCATPGTNISYRRGSANNLPIDSGSCDLIVVSSALHWFERQHFLSEASRIAKPDAWLVIHDHGFSGRMEATRNSMSGFTAFTWTATRHRPAIGHGGRPTISAVGGMSHGSATTIRLSSLADNSVDIC